MITVVDYNAGNLLNVVHALEHLGQTARVAQKPGDLSGAAGIILPGVGAFDPSMLNLRQKGLDQALLEKACAGIPLLGICLGLQLFFPRSEEGGTEKGLDLLSGEVRRLPQDLKVPHMGWNRVTAVRGNPLWRGLPTQGYFYFAHSYYPRVDNEEFETARCRYGVNLTAAVARGRIFGVQFHPEKSGRLGLRLLRNFVQLCHGRW